MLCSRGAKKCAFRCAIWLQVASVALLYGVASNGGIGGGGGVGGAMAQRVVTKNPPVPRVCLNGASDRQGKCVCNPGYSEFEGNCFLQRSTGSAAQTGPPGACPPGTVLWKGFCHYKTLPPMPNILPALEKLVVVPPLRVDLPTPELNDPLDPTNMPEEPEEEDSGPQVIVRPGQGHHLNLTFDRVVNNHNVVNNATTVHAHNVNNVIVHVSRRTQGGGVRTVVIRNNETTVYEEAEQRPPTTSTTTTTERDCEDEEPTTRQPTTTTTTTTVAPTRELPCCKVVSPRVCRKRKDEWVCFHRKQYICSTVCTASVMYLRPRKPTYRKPWLVMPPRPNPFAQFRQCRWGQCPRLDCSGCVDDSGPCDPMCYTYDCMVDNSCQFIDRDMRCPDPSNDLCVLLEQKTINLLKPTEAIDANE